MSFLDQTLLKLSELIQSNRFVNLETDGLEIKPVPTIGGEWKEVHKSINAFLNTRGGIVILGVKEEGTGLAQRYVLSGWKAHAEPNVTAISKQFTDRKGVPLDLTDRFPPMQLRNILGGQVAVVLVDEMPADRKYAFFQGTPYKRVLTGDRKISEAEVEAQEEFREEAIHARELQPLPNLKESDLDLTKLNQFIFQLNQPVMVETMKTDLAQARSFLERRYFLKDNAVTILGALVCAVHPGDYLGFRSHVHGYVDVPRQAEGTDAIDKIVQDKQDFVDNVLQLMELSLGYLLRNIQVGVNIQEGGMSQPQYPSALLRGQQYT